MIFFKLVNSELFLTKLSGMDRISKEDISVILEKRQMNRTIDGPQVNDQ